MQAQFLWPQGRTSEVNTSIALLDFKRTSKSFEIENCFVIFKLETFRHLWMDLCVSESHSARDVVGEIVGQSFC